MADEWRYYRNGTEHGPVAGAELKRLAAQGGLQPSDTIWKPGMAAPVLASRLKSLFPPIDNTAQTSDVAPPFVPSPPQPPQLSPEANTAGSFSNANKFPFPSDEDRAGENPNSDLDTEPVTGSAPHFQTNAEWSSDKTERPRPHAPQTLPLSKIPPRFRDYIQNGETILYASNPSVSAKILSMIVASAVPGIPMLCTSMMLIASGAMVPGIVMTFISAFFMSLLAFIAYLNWKHRFYIITDSRTIVSQGIFNIAVKIIFNQNIQMIAVNTGVVDRWINLNSVQLSTSGSGGGIPIFAAFPGMSPGNVQLRWIADAPKVVGLIAP
ncbi:Bacterial membrane flanked domain protein [Rosistilla ulvae]|uniref:Bacterial membrane flanked domain protein n=1 Tax=Rosistilla ulvae TaxID=1930277 RepID=A0A517LZJ3_9BACT|nr:GYF domain-containing protein [Rosistilla ulvae]QDS88037.1 Bacterial membrane flanked domain protein [Rosistilla ulvae]